MKFEIGQRVRRTSAEPIIEVKPGDIGVVIARPAGASSVLGVFVEWKPGTWFKYDERDQRKLEPADAPAVGAPGLCGDNWQGHVCNQPAGHDGFHRNDMPGVWGSEKQREAMALRAQSQMVDTARAQVDNRTGAELKALLEAAEKSVRLLTNERVMMHGTAADLKGANDKLRSRVDELEGNEAWLRREVVRLGGKARMR